MKPSVGRIVHYVSYGTKNGEYTPECRAAIITEVGQWVTVSQQSDDPNHRTLNQEFHPEACSLSVHNPTGVFFNSGGVPIEHDEETRKPGSWHWPEGTREASAEVLQNAMAAQREAWSAVTDSGATS